MSKEQAQKTGTKIREILYEPNAKQTLFLQAKAKYVAFGGARGGGGP